MVGSEDGKRSRDSRAPAEDENKGELKNRCTLGRLLRSLGGTGSGWGTPGMFSSNSGERLQDDSGRGCGSIAVRVAGIDFVCVAGCGD